MKQLISVLALLFIIVFKTQAQDTLHHVAQSLGGEEYILYDDGLFVYESNLCGISFLSYGNYKKSILGIKFEYDTTKCPSSYTSVSKTDSKSDSITLLFYDMITKKTKYVHFGLIQIGDYSEKYFSDKVSISRQSITADSITINSFYKKFTFKLDPSSSVIKVYLEPLGYNCGINDIYRLKKRPKGYLHKFIVFDEIKKKPWKKGKKRIVKHYYQLNLR